MNIIDSKQVNLSSNSSTTSNFPLNSILYFNMNNILKKEQDILYNTISLIHAEIPVSYYTINSTNNILSINGIIYNLYFGNYNANTFKTMLLNLLGSGWNLILSSITGIYILSYTSNFIINSSSTCYNIMGFTKNTSYTSSSFSLQFPYQCNFLGVKRLKIKSNILATSNLDSFNNGRCNILTTIPCNNSSFGLIIYNNISQFKTIYPNSQLDYIDITITDESDNIINFNGIDIYLTLEINTIRTHLPDNNNLIHLLEKNKEEEQLLYNEE